MPEQPTSRPRIEGEREGEIFTAVVALLVEAGYDKLTFDAVATAVRASKATLYRRWPTKADLVVDAVGRPRLPRRARGRRRHRAACAATCSPGLPPRGPRATTPRPCSAPSSRRCTATRELFAAFRERFVRPKLERTLATFERARDRGRGRRRTPTCTCWPTSCPAICVHDAFVFDIHATPERVAHVMDSVVLPAAPRDPRTASPA